MITMTKDARRLVWVVEWTNGRGFPTRREFGTEKEAQLFFVELSFARETPPDDTAQGEIAA